MKYAQEVINLMAAYPGRPFRMAQIVDSVAAITRGQTKETLRKGVMRVLRMLEVNRQVKSTRGQLKNGTSAQYWWREKRKKWSVQARNNKKMQKK